MIDPRLAMLAPDGPDEMGRELAEGPAAVEATLVAAERLRPELDAAVRRARRVLLVGTGASLAMARTAAALLESPGAGAAGEGSGSRPVLVLEASAALLAPRRTFRPDDLAVVISQSGSSPETLAAARLARDDGAAVMAVTADPDSPLAATAGLVLYTPSGAEGGAATKSELAALAALLALAGALPGDAVGARRVRAMLDAIVADAAGAGPAGSTVGGAAHAWIVGFGSASGLADAASLLLNEKALQTAVSMTPSEFRHGPIEAARSSDVVVLVDTDPPDTRRAAYLGRLGREAEAIGVPLITIGPDPLGPADVRLPVAGPAGTPALLPTLLRLQQVARVAAHVRGTYRDGFRVLHAIVEPADDLG